jgi:hypothetical protein
LLGHLWFEFYRYRFTFRALDTVHFPAGKAGNTLRGALGCVLPEESEPREERPAGNPSGFLHPPRPYVLRANHLNAADFQPGDEFWLDLHDFHVRTPGRHAFEEAFSRYAEEGIGPGRGRAKLMHVESLDLDDRPHPGGPVRIPLDSGFPPASRVVIRFISPTELKDHGNVTERPEFRVLFARIRDRIGTLRTFYGAGPLDIDHRAMAERASAVRATRCELSWHKQKRRSSRTGQVHSIGGFTGDVEYEGPLTEFLPWLAAARWAGVGRHTMWGKGDARVLSYSG